MSRWLTCRSAVSCTILLWWSSLTMRLVTFKQLRSLFGIPFTPQHILRLQKAGRFPLRRKQGNCNFWLYAEVEEWVAKLEVAQPGPSEG